MYETSCSHQQQSDLEIVLLAYWLLHYVLYIIVYILYSISYFITMSYRNKGIICCVHEIMKCIYIGSRLLAERCINTAELFIVLTDSFSLFNN